MQDYNNNTKEQDQDLDQGQTDNSSNINDDLSQDDQEGSQLDPVQVSEDKYRRLLAEFDNFRKSKIQEIASIKKYALADLIRPMIDALDNLDLACKHVSPEEREHSSLFSGMVLTIDSLRNNLKELNVHCFSPEDKSDFDGAKHMAIHQQETIVQALEGKIAAVHQMGYRLHERIIRPAKVSVYRYNPNLLDQKK